ncbi:hypothetical protein DENSPDRAFT_933153 [Dentipellis sp. KUC8613]|nr:hypothetical protein DENSPDRAFT_933153 [Dentipellis sp. KUC8613]
MAMLLVRQMWIVGCFGLSSLVLLLYDHILTFSDEVELIWRSRWTVSKVIFLLNRYTPYIDTGFDVYQQLGYNVPGPVCNILYSTGGWMMVFGTGLSETIIAARTWAVWGGSQKMAYGLGILFIACSILVGVFVDEFLRSMEFSQPAGLLPVVRGCFVSKANNKLYICYIIPLEYETVVIGLFLIKGFEHFKHRTSPFIFYVYRDGILAYLLLLARVNTYFDLIPVALLIYDYFLTFSDEVELIWYSRWSITKILFFLNRYVPFVDIVIAVYHQAASNLSNETCSILLGMSGWLFVGGLGVSEAILIFRAWAIWGRDKRIGLVLVILFVIAWIFISIYLDKFLKSLEFTELGSILPGIQGCFVTKASSTLYVYYVILMSYETALMCITLVKGIHHFRHSSSPFIILLYRDGILAYIYVFAIAVINVLVILLSVPAYATLLSGTQRIIHVILTTRIVLDLRRAAKTGVLIVSNPNEIQLEQSQESGGGRVARLRI